jgi:hypothetical protein
MSNCTAGSNVFRICFFAARLWLADITLMFTMFLYEDKENEVSNVKNLHFLFY